MSSFYLSFVGLAAGMVALVLLAGALNLAAQARRRAKFAAAAAAQRAIESQPIPDSIRWLSRSTGRARSPTPC